MDSQLRAQLRKQPPQSSSKGNFFVRVRFGGVPSTVEGCSFFACSWRLPAYNGAFLLTVDNFSFFAYSWSFFFTYSFSFFTYSWSFFAYSGEVCLISTLRDCKQRSLTVSKKAPIVSKKATPTVEEVVRVRFCCLLTLRIF